MPVFKYVAKDIQGEYHRGEVETADDHQTANLLRRKKLIPISIKIKNDSGSSTFESIFSRVSFSDLVITTRQLATMIEAGLVLSESLDILEEQQTNKRLKKVLEKVSADIKGGIDFASALDKHPDVFPPLYCKLVRAGQASGKLDTVLLQLAENLEKEREFKSKVKGAMIYPIVVVTMMVGVMLVMVFFVMPKLMGLYKDSDMDLPLPTKIMMALAGFLLNFWWLIIIMTIIAFIFYRRYSETPNGRIVIDKIILKTPVVGRIVKMVILTNFTRTLGLLISSGISILDAIKIVADISGNEVYKQSLSLAYRGVERGLLFSSQILGLPVFPKIVGQMIRTGEETGKLDDVMFRIADYFESETDNSLKNATTLIEPIVLVLLGIGVALLVVSVIMPIYQLSTNIK
ncbi:MAG: type II secretion system F family protein [Armatimonadetes bacterium]|nr:MAG: type II secretion system F family protein [Armatimonadota bacterium]